MITKWRLENFKSIGKPTELDLGPLTILAGANSSGKSTIIQSMLLITQTLGNRISSRSVILNGPIIKLGAFNDLKTYGGENQNIQLGWNLEPQGDRYGLYEFSSSSGLFSRFLNEYKSLSCDLSIDAGAQDENTELYQLQPRVAETDISWIIENENDKEESYSLSLKKTPDREEKMKKLPEDGKFQNQQALEYDIEVTPTNQTRRKDPFSKFELVGVHLRHFLPLRVVNEYSRAEEFASYIISLISPSESDLIDEIRFRGTARRFEDFTIKENLRSLFQEKLSEVSPGVLKTHKKNFPNSPKELYQTLRTLREKDPDLAKSFSNESFSNRIRESVIKDYGEMRSLRAGDYRSFGFINEMSLFMEDYFLSRINYLGPLRDEPKPLYPLAGNDPSDVGIKGEHTAAVLDLNRDRRVNYMPSSSFSKPQIKKEETEAPLKEAITDWLQYLDVASDVATKDMGKLGRELKVTTKDTDRGQDLTHVGVGVSQVLPILVLCLLAEPDSTIIIEQPELHLHPKVQTLLADFFVSMSLMGKQCILETHSEYLINRLRFRAAAADQDSFASLLKIFFVEKINGLSNFRSIDVNKYGAIPDWPEGFFDQSQEEAENILRAASQKRKKEMRK